MSGPRDGWLYVRNSLNPNSPPNRDGSTRICSWIRRELSQIRGTLNLDTYLYNPVV